ncbi:ice-binding family protein [Demequina sp.]|uniref:ice-binding family protein n=1 Tax=Demequina sp. TaxID=2050685 RepID=UPI0025C04B4F|nr:ice-binding family protein [Demequina sp.]
MAHTSLSIRLSVMAACAALFALVPVAAASAATSIDGPIGMGTAEPFGVLAHTTVTNTGSSIVNGDVGLSPGTSVTGFPPGIFSGTLHQTDAVAAQAKVDLTTAYGVAAGLTPTQTGLGDLAGMSLTPGVYSGGALSLNGELTLAGTAESVWVFQASSTLTVGSGALITMTGGASACNVFWQVGSSATIGSGANFVGTVMADASITANTSAVITGRLLARTGAVTLDTNTITAPTGCAAAGTVTSSPEITSGTPSDAVVGVDYSYTITASGMPTPTYAVSSGSLPAGLTLDATTGVVSGAPTAEGTSEFDITASNGASPAATETYSIEVTAGAVFAAGDELADTGADAAYVSAMALGLVSLGFVLLWGAGRRVRA